MLAHVALERRRRARLFVFQRVPFINCQNNRTACFDSITGDGRIERCDSLLCVKQNNRHVSPLQTLAGHHHRKFFGHRQRSTLAPDTRSIDEAKSLR